MKNLLLALVILAVPCIARADNLVQNGDFSLGGTGWQGDGMTPDAYAQAHPSPVTNAWLCKGLIVPLDPTRWTRIYQSFPTVRGTQFSIVVRYMLSPDVTVSKNQNDYVKIGNLIQVPGFENFGSINGHPGEFYGTLGDTTGTVVSMEVYEPKYGSSALQTYVHTYPPVPQTGSKTFALAFPPGTGTVTIVSVVVTSN